MWPVQERRSGVVMTGGRSSLPGGLYRILELPEINVAVFGFMLNFIWEFLQAPFFQSLPRMPHWEAVKLCTLATIGDAAIMLGAFWCVAAATRARSWILHAGWRRLAGFAGIGIAITIVVELLSVSAGRWEYSGSMPVVPYAGIGLLPLAQWIVLPPLTAWFVRRQLT